MTVSAEELFLPLETPKFCGSKNDDRDPSTSFLLQDFGSRSFSRAPDWLFVPLLREKEKISRFFGRRFLFLVSGRLDRHRFVIFLRNLNTEATFAFRSSLTGR